MKCRSCGHRNRLTYGQGESDSPGYYLVLASVLLGLTCMLPFGMFQLDIISNGTVLEWTVIFGLVLTGFVLLQNLVAWSDHATGYGVKCPRCKKPLRVWPWSL